MKKEKKIKKGFAAMDPEKARAIQSKGGSACPQNLKNLSKKQRIEIARAGGRASHGGGRPRKNSKTVDK